MLRSCRNCFQYSHLTYGILERSQLAQSSLRCRIGFGTRGFAYRKARVWPKDAKIHVETSQVTTLVSQKAAAYESLNKKLARSQTPTALYHASSQRQVRPMKNWWLSVLDCRSASLHSEYCFQTRISFYMKVTLIWNLCSTSLAAIQSGCF